MSSEANKAKQQRGFLTTESVMHTIGQSNTVLDPHSLLISNGVVVGTGNTFYPNVVIECGDTGEVNIGNDNIFYPGTHILGTVGKLAIGDGNTFGTGGCTIRANGDGIELVIGSGGRYSDGANIMGNSRLGNGSQVLGGITVQSCILAGGGTFEEPDPDKRGAVLKGFGLARGLTLKTGQVVNGSGNFADAPIEQQRAYHPK